MDLTLIKKQYEQGLLNEKNPVHQGWIKLIEGGEAPKPKHVEPSPDFEPVYEPGKKVETTAQPKPKKKRGLFSFLFS